MNSYFLCSFFEHITEGRSNDIVVDIKEIQLNEELLCFRNRDLSKNHHHGLTNKTYLEVTESSCESKTLRS